MIQADTKDLEASFIKAIIRIEQKLSNMVQGFAYEFTVTAIANTPLGDDVLYEELYNKRINEQDWQSFGLEPEKGFARGAWQTSLNGSLSVQEFYGDNSGNQAGAAAKQSMLSYKLGQRVIIGNYGPYIQSLEQGSSPQTTGPLGSAISQPTLDQVLLSYKVDLKRYYSAG
jgi:hypothetical protein